VFIIYTVRNDSIEGCLLQLDIDLHEIVSNESNSLIPCRTLSTTKQAEFNRTLHIRMVRNTRAAAKALEAEQRIDGHTSPSTEATSRPVEVEVEPANDMAIDHDEDAEPTKSKGKKKRSKKGKKAKKIDEETNGTEDASVNANEELSKEPVNEKLDEVTPETDTQSSRGKFDDSPSWPQAVARQIPCLFTYLIASFRSTRESLIQR
jgi:hypothetical protein